MKKRAGTGKKTRLKDISDSTDPNFLFDVFRGGDEYECNAAVESFTKLPEKKYDSFLAATKNADFRVRKWAAIALGRSDGGLFSQQLIGMLKDSSSQVREAAFCALYDHLNEKIVCQLGDAVKKARNRHMIELGGLLLDEAEKKGLRKNGKPGLNGFQAMMAQNAGLSKQDIDELRRKGFSKPIVSNMAFLEPIARKREMVH